MKIPVIDKRTKNDLIKYFKKIAPYYVPSWRFDEEDMDMGSVLVFIFTEMFMGTVDRFNDVLYKNFLMFLNSINSNMYASVAAKGYITLQLVDGVNEGIMVKKGEKLSAEGTDFKRIIFETMEDVFVTPAHIDDIYNVSFLNDRIVHIYNKDNDEGNIVLFNNKGENLQKHEFLIKHKSFFNMSSYGIINILIECNPSEKYEILKNLCDLENVTWEYKSAGKYIELKAISIENGNIKILKNFENELDQRDDEDENGMLRCTIKDIHKFKSLDFTNILLSSESQNIKPYKIYSNDIEQKNNQFYAFGEKFLVYNELDISCNEVFTKKGADIILKFDMQFKKIPIDRLEPEPNINWKLIMNKSQFKKPIEYEIGISEVIWEYWNGIGWARLDFDDDYSRLFYEEDDYRKRKIILKFKCPYDMDDTIINSFNGKYIRARILKVDNAYMNRGWYISPVIDNIRLSYKYNKPIKPEKVITLNNMIEKEYLEDDIDGTESLEMLKEIEDENNISYFGFEKKPEGTPIRILMCLENVLSKDIPILAWEYYAEEGWRILNVIDKTENFRKSGIISFAGECDFKKKDLFGKNLYWIRVYNPAKAYENEEMISPVITGMYINSTPIVQNDALGEEKFYIDAFEKNKICDLGRNNINNIEVWINEYKKISDEEIAELSQDDVKVVCGSTGEIEEIWVKWNEINDFIVAEKDERSYIVDRNLGLVYFGDGINGKIPSSQKNESIKINYSVGGGERGNLLQEQITSMTRNLGYINKIFNPLPTSGGCDMEKLDEAIERSPKMLRNRNRAVTNTDYEVLAKEASRNIIKAKCFSGRNSVGNKEPGSVTLVLLQKGNFENDLYFTALREEVENYIISRNVNMLNQKGKLYIIPPYFVNFNIKIEAQALVMDDIFSVKYDIEQAISRFIDPMDGNFNGEGWQIGEIPKRTQILNSLRNIKGIKRIKSLVIVASVNYKGVEKEIDIEENSKKIYAMPLNGKHNIHVSI